MPKDTQANPLEQELMVLLDLAEDTGVYSDELRRRIFGLVPKLKLTAWYRTPERDRWSCHAVLGGSDKSLIEISSWTPRGWSPISFQRQTVLWRVQERQPNGVLVDLVSNKADLRMAMDYAVEHLRNQGWWCWSPNTEPGEGW